MSPYRAKTIAYFFLELGEKDKIPISPMKLQKLIYFAHGWCLAIFKKPLIAESVEAWLYGPVIGAVYHEFKEFGSNPIKGKVPTREIRARLLELKKDTDIIRLLEKVWEVYGGYDAIKLSQMTHLPGTPWLKARENAEKKINVTIEDELIQQYFVEHAGK